MRVPILALGPLQGTSSLRPAWGAEEVHSILLIHALADVVRFRFATVADDRLS